MNDTKPFNSPAVASWPNNEQRARLTDTTTPLGNAKPEPLATGLLDQAAQGAHEGIDRLADSAAPAVQSLGEGLSAAEDALTAKTRQLRATRDAWAESLRTKVRRNPLTSVAAALALGAVILRITR